MPSNLGYSRGPRADNGADGNRLDGVASGNRHRSKPIRHDYCTCVKEFNRLLNIRREIAAGQRTQPHGYYFGDGVARTLDGTPFEPLDWKKVRP